MGRVLLLAVVVVLFLSFGLEAQKRFQSDVFPTSGGELVITFIGHGTLMFTYQGQIIHVDPWTRLADYAALPKADLILLTHEHQDHLDVKAIELLKKDGMILLMNQACQDKVKDGLVMRNQDVKTVAGLKIEAVPAYNLVHMRSPGQPYHPRGVGNGYVITFGDKRVYVAGDTENTPEMKDLKDIDIAFLPMNLPYTMTPEMVADAAKSFKPKVLYPYHYGDTDPAKLLDLMKDAEGIEVRVREMR